MNKKLIIVVIAIIFITGGYLLHQKNNEFIKLSTNLDTSSLETTEDIDPLPNNAVDLEKTNTLSKGCSALSIVSPILSSEVNFPTQIIGTIDRTQGCTWTTFEGSAGTVELFFSTDDAITKWQSLTAPKIIKVPNWTAPKNDFVVTYDFNNGGIGLLDGHAMKFVFTAENPSGIPENEQTYELLFTLGTTQTVDSI